MNLKQITDGLDLSQLIKSPTRTTQSTRTQTDLVLSNRPERISKSFNMITGLSDHNLTLVARKLTKKRFSPSNTKEHEALRIPINMQEHFKSTIHSFKWNDLLLGKDLSEGSQIFSSKVQSIITEFTSKLKCRNKKNSLPWINADILKLMKERDLALKMAIRTNLFYDKYHFAMLRNKVIMGLRKARADFIISEARGNSKIIWNQLKKNSWDNITKQ